LIDSTEYRAIEEEEEEKKNSERYMLKGRIVQPEQ
jgi:hypothetical protein